MSGSIPFIDTNILIYAAGEGRRSDLAKRLAKAPYRISVQTLNEFANTARRKLKFDWLEINLALEEIKTGSSVILPITRESHERAMALVQRYSLSVYDANQLAVALDTDAETFLSEDMHDGLVIENRLTIHNPFKA